MTQMILSITIPVITALFVLIGYRYQKDLELKKEVKKNKLTIYSNFFRSYWSLCYSNDDNIKADNIHWKTMIILYAPDFVLDKFEALQQTIHGKENHDFKQRKPRVDELLIAMRLDVLGKTRCESNDIIHSSPVLLDDESKS